MTLQIMSKDSLARWVGGLGQISSSMEDIRTRISSFVTLKTM